MNYSELKTNLGKKGNDFRIKGLMCKYINYAQQHI